MYFDPMTLERSCNADACSQSKINETHNEKEIRNYISNKQIELIACERKEIVTPIGDCWTTKSFNIKRHFQYVLS